MKPALVACLLTIFGAVALPLAAQSPEPQETPAAAVDPHAEATPAPAPTAPPAPAPVTPPTVYFEKLRVVVDGRAEVSGVIQLKFQPQGGEAKLINVNVLAKMKAKDIANDIWKELSLAGGSSYRVKLGGKEIEVKKANKKVPPFALTILGQSATGVSVGTKR